MGSNEVGEVGVGGRVLPHVHDLGQLCIPPELSPCRLEIDTMLALGHAEVQECGFLVLREGLLLPLGGDE